VAGPPGSPETTTPVHKPEIGESDQCAVRQASEELWLLCLSSVFRQPSHPRLNRLGLWLCVPRFRAVYRCRDRVNTYLSAFRIQAPNRQLPFRAEPRPVW
jgi:hypothetical protein